MLQSSPEFFEGVNIQRLDQALVALGVATPASSESMAAGVQDAVNALTRAVVAQAKRQPLSNEQIYALIGDLSKEIISKQPRYATMTLAQQIAIVITAAVRAAEQYHGIR